MTRSLTTDHSSPTPPSFSFQQACPGGLRHGLAPVKDSLNSSFQDLTARARTLDRELQNDVKAAEKKKERANKLLKNTKPTAVTIANAEPGSGSAEDSGKE
ncbi:hypothetical protein NpNSSI1_00007410 [Neofusicoccum parvum]|nr:hypothetical protein NpNSSI1_00007410 [Neofusicoccum parvum]